MCEALTAGTFVSPWTDGTGPPEATGPTGSRRNPGRHIGQPSCSRSTTVTQCKGTRREVEKKHGACMHLAGDGLATNPLQACFFPSRQQRIVVVTFSTVVILGTTWKMPITVSLHPVLAVVAVLGIIVAHDGT